MKKISLIVVALSAASFATLDKKLWKAIESPHAGSGMAIEEATPFVEEVPSPR